MKQCILTNLEKECQKSLILFFEKENNKPIYKKQNLKWFVADRFYWLELHIYWITFQTFNYLQKS
jgi:hypothetical protein